MSLLLRKKLGVGGWSSTDWLCCWLYEDHDMMMWHDVHVSVSDGEQNAVVTCWIKQQYVNEQFYNFFTLLFLAWLMICAISARYHPPPTTPPPAAHRPPSPRQAASSGLPTVYSAFTASCRVTCVCYVSFRVCLLLQRQLGSQELEGSLGVLVARVRRQAVMYSACFIVVWIIPLASRAMMLAGRSVRAESPTHRPTCSRSNLRHD